MSRPVLLLHALPLAGTLESRGPPAPLAVRVGFVSENKEVLVG